MYSKRTPRGLATVSIQEKKRWNTRYNPSKSTAIYEHALAYELRKTGLLRTAEGGYPHGDLELSPLIYHAVGLPRLLPPLDAKMLDQKEIEKMGSNLHIIDLSARNKTPGIVDAAQLAGQPVDRAATQIGRAAGRERG